MLVCAVLQSVPVRVVSLLDVSWSECFYICCLPAVQPRVTVRFDAAHGCSADFSTVTMHKFVLALSMGMALTIMVVDASAR